jgi:hypothetical protein
MTCLKLYQFKRITWWCLSVLESILKYVMEFILQSILKSFWLDFEKKNHGLPEFCQTHLLEVGLMKISVGHAPLSIVRHVGLHVDFSSTNFSLCF